MIFKRRFECLEPVIRRAFDAAQANAGPEASRVVLVLTDETSPLARTNAAIYVVPNEVSSEIQVVVTWAALGTLWMLAQGAFLVSKQMFEGVRAGKDRLLLEAGSPQETGMLLLDLVSKILQLRPDETKNGVAWPDQLPQPDSVPADGSDAAAANNWLQKALEWIIRHELAHVDLGHLKRPPEHGDERAADQAATTGMKGQLEADQTRPLGGKVQEKEMRLEVTATALVFGLIWVGLLEISVGSLSKEHPPIATRIFELLEQLGLREDSFALEITSHILKAWIDPQGESATAPTARDAAQDALVKLNAYMRSLLTT